MDNSSRFQLVDSLYGPGTVGAWLLTLCSVLISWTLNVSSRRRDTISVDVIAALLLPSISASHLIVQIVRLPISVADAITAESIEAQRLAFALEAPLNVCETFSMAALALALCCGPWWKGPIKFKRLGLVVMAGLFSWGTVNIMFAMATMKGIQTVDTTLSRPYLFLLTPIVACAWGFLALCCVVGGLVWLYSRATMERARISREDEERVKSKTEITARIQLLTEALASNRITKDEIERTKRIEAQLARLYEERAMTQKSESRSLVMVSSLTMFFLPCSFVSALFGIELSDTKVPSTHHRSFFLLIPRSENSIASLDQALAFTGGVIVLASALWKAYRGRYRLTSQDIVQRRRSV